MVLRESEIRRKPLSKDYVEHLRSVHFALTTASVVLIIICTSSSPQTFRSARAQLLQISDLSYGWSQEGYRAAIINAFRERAAIVLSQSPASLTFDSRHFGDTIELPGTGLTFSALLNSEQSDVESVVSSQLHLGYGPRLGDEEMFPTLTEFRNFWDRIGSVRAVVIPVVGDKIYVYDRENTFGSFNVQRSAKQPLAQVYFHVTPCPDELRMLFREDNGICYRGESSIGQLKTRSRTVTLIWPLNEYAPFRGDLQSLFFKRYSWFRGSFHDSFGDLDKVTEGYQQHPLREIAAYIDLQEKVSAKAFRFSGVSFPLEGTTVWGMVVILVVQAYFYIYLGHAKAVLGPDDEGWGVPWIGIDQSLWARVLLTLSIVVAPIVAMWLLGHLAYIRGADDPSFWSRLPSYVQLFVATPLSAFFSLASIKKIVALKPVTHTNGSGSSN